MLSVNSGEVYGNVTKIDHVVLTHPDGDHAAGLETILKTFNVGTLWMNRPWVYINELLPLFEYDYTESGLTQRLKKNYQNIANLEKIADEEGIEIKEALQGMKIGEFTVLSPSLQFFLDMIVDSEKTPEPEREATIAGRVYEVVRKAVNYVRSIWGEENLKGETEGTSAENEMSVIQYSNLSNENILLTGDAGVKALTEAYNFATLLGIQLPGIIRFQVPHHGSRRNISSSILDLWVGNKIESEPLQGEELFSAMISANENDEEHPRKAVIRALIHRGARVLTTENKEFIYWKPLEQPLREGCGSTTSVEYPMEMEED